MSYHRTLPTGTILPFGGSNPPNGWLLCDGSSKTQGAYPKLYAAIGKNWGSGDAADTFSLPDLRGLFCRGFDALSATSTFSNRDPNKSSRTHIKTSAVVGNVVGSYQDYAQQTHSHGNASSTDSPSISHNHGIGFSATSHGHTTVDFGYGGGGHTSQHNHSVTYPYRNKITKCNRYDLNYDAWPEDEITTSITSGSGGEHTHDAGVGNTTNHGHDTMSTANVNHNHTNSNQTSKAPTLTNTAATVTSEIFPNNAYVNFIIKI